MRHIDPYPLAHFAHMATPHPEEPGKLPLHTVLPQKKGHGVLASEGGVPLFCCLVPVKGGAVCAATFTQHIQGHGTPTVPSGCEPAPQPSAPAPSWPTQLRGLARPLPTLPSTLRRGHWPGRSQGSFPGLTWAGPTRSYRSCQPRQAPHHPHPCCQVLHLQLEPGQLW